MSPVIPFDKNRPRKTPGQKKSSREPAPEKFLRFTLGGKSFAVEAIRIVEVVMPRTLIQGTASEPFLLGAINLRGNIIPVTDLRRHLGLASEQDSPKGRFLVFREKELFFAVSVENVDSKLLEAFREAIPEDAKEPFKNGIRVEDVVIPLFTPEGLLTDRDLHLMQKVRDSF